MSYFEMFPLLNQKKNILKKKKKIHQEYEFGAHFKYTDLFGRLINLINILPKERLGENGIYFIDDNNNNNNNNKRNSDISNDLIKNFYKKIKFGHSISIKNKNFLKLKNNSKFKNFKPIDTNKILLYKNYLFNLPNKKNYKNDLNNNYSTEKNNLNDNNISKNKTSNFSFLKNNRNKHINNIYKIYNFNDKIFHTIDNNTNNNLKLPKIEYKFKSNKNI